MNICMFAGSVIFLASLCFGAKAETNGSDYIAHRIKPGESVSLICIEYYGNYNNGMGQAIKGANPSLQNINVIIAGKNLLLPRPQTAPKEEPGETALFTRNVDITQGVVTCVEGKALYMKSGGGKAGLAVNTLVYPGDTVQTGPDGRVEIVVNRESVVRIREQSRLVLGEYRNKEKNEGKTNAGLEKGCVWTKVKKFADKLCRFELSLPTAIAGVYGTVYQTSVAENGDAEVKVYGGEVSVAGKAPASAESGDGPLTEISGPTEVPGPREVTMEEWVRIVRSMQKVTIDKNGVPSEVSAFKKEPSSSWEKWNEERDRLVAGLFGEK